MIGVGVPDTTEGRGEGKNLGWWPWQKIVTASPVPLDGGGVKPTPNTSPEPARTLNPEPTVDCRQHRRKFLSSDLLASNGIGNALLLMDLTSEIEMHFSTIGCTYRL